MDGPVYNNEKIFPLILYNARRKLVLHAFFLALPYRKRLARKASVQLLAPYQNVDKLVNKQYRAGCLYIISMLRMKLKPDTLFGLKMATNMNCGMKQGTRYKCDNKMPSKEVREHT